MSAASGSEQSGYSSILNSPSAHTLVAGDLGAVFLPTNGMLCASLRHRGVEVLGRVQNLEAAAAKGSSVGIPFLHPWANRLAGLNYHVAGKVVALDISSSLLHFDASGLPMHGVPWPLLSWEVIDANQSVLVSSLDWSRNDLLALFPFPHRLEMKATLSPGGLSIETTVIASSDGPVPVSFGFHPYFAFPRFPRAHWHLELPAMRKLSSDSRGIPTGEEKPYSGYNATLGDFAFDDGFALLEPHAAFSVSGAGRKITIEFLEGYPYAQVFTPKDADYIALEPMTAPTNALASGAGPILLESGASYRAAFQVRVETIS